LAYIAFVHQAAASIFKDDQTSKRRVGQLTHFVEAYESGLARPLSAAELSELPLAIARTPLFMMRYLALMAPREAATPVTETLPDLRWSLTL
jgi:Ser/Thr protein kinase RdoA (MazF antagonist)